MNNNSLKTRITLVCLLTTMVVAQAQVDTLAARVVQANKLIDAAVVEKDLATLRKLYADDFVFKHGTGTVDNKESWLRSVGRPEQRFVSRVQDSTEVELHADIALVSGVLTITRLDDRKEVRYRIWYIRIFRLRDRMWQLISHRTTREIHL